MNDSADACYLQTKICMPNSELMYAGTCEWFSSGNPGTENFFGRLPRTAGMLTKHAGKQH